MAMNNTFETHKQYFSCLAWGVSILIIEVVCLYYAIFYYAAKQYNIPLITSDYISCKVRTKTTSGIKILNSDKTIYEKIQSKNDKNNNIKILPLPEQPIHIKLSAKSMKNIHGMGHGDQKYDTDDILHNSSYPIINTTINDNNYDNTMQSNLDIVILHQPDARLQHLLSNPSKLYKPPIKYRLLLGSSYNIERTHDLWHEILEENNKILSKYSYTIQTISSNSEQPIYNILVGEFNSFSDALRICKKLISNQQTCLVVRY